jgi:hypothetical protein
MQYLQGFAELLDTLFGQSDRIKKSSCLIAVGQIDRTALKSLTLKSRFAKNGSRKNSALFRLKDFLFIINVL